MRCSSRLSDRCRGHASCAHAFIILAPTVEHSSTKLPCNVATYQMRMWCRAENLCHSLTNGMNNMWLATAADACRPLEDDPEMMHSNLRVFQGVATDESDKLTLVVPILGLYASLVALRYHDDAPSSAEEPLADKIDRATARPKAQFRHQMWHRLQESKSEIFPETLLLPLDAATGRNRASARGGGPAQRAAMERVQLFGPLVQMVEQRLKWDTQLRESLVNLYFARDRQLSGRGKPATVANLGSHWLKQSVPRTDSTRELV